MVEADRPALAVDIGGTKLAAGLVGPGGRLLSWEQTPTRRDLDAEGLWRTVDALITRVLDAAGLAASAGASAGRPRLRLRRPDGMARRARVPAQHPRLARLPAPRTAGGAVRRRPGPGAQRRHLPDRRGALARRRPGHPQHARHGRLHRRRRRPDPGRRAACRARPATPGTSGTWWSTRTTARSAAAARSAAWRRWPAARRWPRGRRARAGGRASPTPPPRTWPRTGRPGTRSAWPRCAGPGTALGIAIASATNLCDLEVVAIGGGLSQAGSLLFGPLEQALPRAHPAGVRPPGPGRARGPGPERGPDRRRRPGAGRRPLLARR